MRNKAAVRRVLLTVLLVIGSTFVVAVPGQATFFDPTETNPSQSSGTDIVAEYTVDPLMGSPHKLRVEARFSIRSDLSEFDVRIRNSTEFGHVVTVDSADGLSIRKSGSFVDLSYTGETTTPSVTYTVEKSDIQLGRGNPSPMIAGHDWMVFRHEGVTKLQFVPEDLTVSSSQDVKTDRPVFQGSKATLVGAHELYNHSGSEQDITLVVPEEANMVAEPTDVLELLETTSRLVVRETPGDRTHVFVLPDDAAGELSQGLSLSPDMFVPARSKLNQGIDGQGAQSVWAHEMAHVHHEFYSPNPNAPKMRWISEGHADYIAAYASYLNGDIPFSKFYNWSQHGYEGEEEKLHDDILSDPSTYDGSTPYSKGRRVLLALDAKIRQESRGNRTVFDVFYLLIQDDAAVTFPEFKAAVKEVVGRSLDDWIEKYVTTRAAPTAPRNESLFDSMPASGIEAANYTGPSESGPPQADITYLVDPLPDEPRTIRVRLTLRSNQVAQFTIFVENASSDGYTTDITTKSGVREEEFNNLIHLFPETRSNTVTVEYTMTRTEPYPSPGQYSGRIEAFVQGVSFEPGSANITETIIVEADSGRIQVTRQRSSEESSTSDDGHTNAPGQPGFTASSSIIAVLLVAIMIRRHQSN